MDKSKEIAKLKRQSQEIAGQIHDIVEETLWTEYSLLPDLTNELIAKIREYEGFLKG